MKPGHYSATVPEIWIDIGAGGTVYIRTRNMVTDGSSEKYPYRRMTWKPKLKTDQDAIRRLIGHINLTALGDEGAPARQ